VQTLLNQIKLHSDDWSQAVAHVGESHPPPKQPAPEPAPAPAPVEEPEEDGEPDEEEEEGGHAKTKSRKKR
jgi:hypothetical protein